MGQHGRVVFVRTTAHIVYEIKYNDNLKTKNSIGTLEPKCQVIIIHSNLIDFRLNNIICIERERERGRK